MMRIVGDSDGLGDTRKKELVKSAMSLGVRDEDDVFVVDNPYVLATTHSSSLHTTFRRS